MDASIVDIRYHMKDVLKALERNETVRILYRGKLKGTIRPIENVITMRVEEHPFFNMNSGELTVEEEMEVLRGGRHRAI